MTARLLIALACTFYLSLGFSVPRYRFNLPDKQRQFMHLTQEMRCLVCQDESLIASNAPLAAELRSVIYQRVQAGESSARIIHFLTGKYGDFILFRPPVNASTWLLWGWPFLLLLIAAVVVWRLIKRR